MKNNTVQFPANEPIPKTFYGEVICSGCGCSNFQPTVKLETCPDPKGIIGQVHLKVMQVFTCTKCGVIWTGPK